MRDVLEKAWNWRKKGGFFEETQALRVFHGPGEGSGELKPIAIDRFGDHYWITEWAEQPDYENLITFLKSKGALSAVALSRPKQGLPTEPKVVFGQPPDSKFEVLEGKARFWIRFQKTRHPGLFLDHAPLRKWLIEKMSGLRILNTFAYTGSLSVAARLGGAKSVTTLDLSKPALEWAKDNFELNGFQVRSSDGPDSTDQFFVADYFERMPKLRARSNLFDCVILDPPSFSRGEKGNFSTAKDLVKLHRLAMEVLEEGGYLVTSINSANVPLSKFESEVWEAADLCKMRFKKISKIQLPETFPDDYLKGWILKRV